MSDTPVPTTRTILTTSGETVAMGTVPRGYEVIGSRVDPDTVRVWVAPVAVDPPTAQDTPSRPLIRRVLAGVLIAGVLTGAAALACPGTASAAEPCGDPCTIDRYEVVEDTSDDGSRPDPIADCLMRVGARGVIGDGGEYLYGPRWLMSACVSRPDSVLA